MRYFLIAGEASGDLHGANLIQALKAQDPCATFAFMGGERMAMAAGVAPVVHYREIAFMGFLSVIKHAKDIARVASFLQDAIRSFTPEVVIPIDASGFNFRYILPFVQQELPQAAIFYYIPPKVWAWRKWRTKTLRKYVRKVLCILPFEESFFKNRGVEATFIGNPCVDAVGDYSNSWGKKKGDTTPPYVALLAGSRKGEIRSNLPIMLETMRRYYPQHLCVIAGAPGVDTSFYAPFIEGHEASLRFDSTYDILSKADFALVTSGTATLETALIGTPQIVCYHSRGWRIENILFKFFSVRYFSLVNLILNAPLVEELLAAEVTPERLHRAIQRLQSRHSEIVAGYDTIRQTLGTSPASHRAARHILQDYTTQ